VCSSDLKGHEVFFITNEDKYNGHKSSKVLTSIGCINQIYTVEGITREMMFPDRREGTKDPFEECLEIWEPLVISEIEKIKPDIVVCDFFSRVGITAADKMGIPSVINAPALVEFMMNWGFAGAPDTN
jgi:predicted glycosyltransferase